MGERLRKPEILEELCRKSGSLAERKKVLFWSAGNVQPDHYLYRTAQGVLNRLEEGFSPEQAAGDVGDHNLQKFVPPSGVINVRTQ